MNRTKVTISINIERLDGDDDYIRVSLRSKDDFPVNKLSNQYFNGGGHQRAAGGKLAMAIGDVEEYFVKCLTEFKQL